MSNGRIWWPVASTGVILFPGFAGSLGLGQNSVFSLAILIWGWVLISRGRPGWGGIVWGLLAFKPVWAAAFFLVPLWTGHWRVGIAMLMSGSIQAALTLPVVGWHGWTDWLHVGGEAARIAQSDEVWIVRGRDLIGLPRRWLDFNSPAAELQNNLATTLIGWSLWVMVIDLTSRIAVLRKPATYFGSGPAFLFFGAWLSCVHFMYYDVLLAALPVCLLFKGPRWPHWICHILVAVLFFAPAIPAIGWGEPPLETLCILGLWIASGWDWIRSEPRDTSESLLSASGRETLTAS
jgi:arabinofuranan 3-O-arabinosyltransferase